MKNQFMKRAIELSIKSVNSGGGPFGSVIVKGEKSFNINATVKGGGHSGQAGALV